MSRDQTFVVVGAGLAGAKAAETLREEVRRSREVGEAYRSRDDA